jgi:hypothetical protein
MSRMPASLETFQQSGSFVCLSARLSVCRVRVCSRICLSVVSFCPWLSCVGLPVVSVCPWLSCVGLPVVSVCPWLSCVGLSVVSVCSCLSVAVVRLSVCRVCLFLSVRASGCLSCLSVRVCPCVSWQVHPVPARASGVGLGGGSHQLATRRQPSARRAQAAISSPRAGGHPSQLAARRQPSARRAQAVIRVSSPRAGGHPSQLAARRPGHPTAALSSWHPRGDGPAPSPDAHPGAFPVALACQWLHWPVWVLLDDR